MFDGGVLFETTSAEGKLESLKRLEKLVSEVAEFTNLMVCGMMELSLTLEEADREANDVRQNLRVGVGTDRLSDLIFDVFGVNHDVSECRTIFEWFCVVMMSMEHMSGKLTHLLSNNQQVCEVFDQTLSYLDLDSEFFPGGWLHHTLRLLMRLGEVSRYERVLFRQEIDTRICLSTKQMQVCVPDESTIVAFTDMTSLIPDLHNMLDHLVLDIPSTAPMFADVAEIVRDLRVGFDWLRMSLSRITAFSSVCAETRAYLICKDYFVRVPFTPIVLNWDLDPPDLLSLLRGVNLDLYNECELIRSSLESLRRPCFTGEPPERFAFLDMLRLYAREIEVTFENIESVADCQAEVSRLRSILLNKQQVLDGLAASTSLAFLNQRINYLRSLNEKCAIELGRYRKEISCVREHIRVLHTVSSLERSPKVGCPCFPRRYALGVCGHTFCESCYSGIMSSNVLVCPHCSTTFSCKDVIVINYSSLEDHV